MTKLALRLAPVALALAWAARASVVQAGDVTVKPVGEYAKIDTRLAQETMSALLEGGTPGQQRAIAAIQAAPQKYAPPVFYALASVLFDQGLRDEGAFWLYAGQLRARYDANRCADVSARQAVAVLTDRFGPPINLYMFKDLPKLEALIPKVVDWDRKTPHDYDHRWINLHGMNAIMESLDGTGKPKPLSLPRAQWDAIAEKTRADFLAGFRQALAMAKQRAAAPAPPTVHAEPGWERRLVGTWKEELESVLVHMPKQVMGAIRPGEAGRREMADRMRVLWTVQPDSITISTPGMPGPQPPQPNPYRVAKVDGNVVTLSGHWADGTPTEWTIEYLGPDLVRLLMGTEEVYKLRRVPAAPAAQRH